MKLLWQQSQVEIKLAAPKKDTLQSRRLGGRQCTMICSLPFDIRERLLVLNTEPSVIGSAVAPGVPLLLLPDAPAGGFLRETFQVRRSCKDGDIQEFTVEGVKEDVFHSAMEELNRSFSMKWTVCWEWTAGERTSIRRAWVYAPDRAPVLDSFVHAIVDAATRERPRTTSLLYVDSDCVLVARHSRC